MDHEADAMRTDLMTLTRYVLNEQSKHPESTGDYTILLAHIVLGCKFVCSAVNKVSELSGFFQNFTAWNKYWFWLSGGTCKSGRIGWGHKYPGKLVYCHLWNELLFHAEFLSSGGRAEENGCSLQWGFCKGFGQQPQNSKQADLVTWNYESWTEKTKMENLFSFLFFLLTVHPGFWRRRRGYICGSCSSWKVKTSVMF